MTNGKQLLSDYAAELDKTEKELIAQKRAVRAFLKNHHNEKATKKYVESLEKTETRMEDIMADLLDLKEQAQFRQAAEKLCKRCAGLDRYTTHMNKVLSDDLEQKKKSKIDWVKNTTFFFGLPLSFFVAVKKGLLQNYATPEQAAGIGLVISSGVLAIENIKAGFKTTGRALCKAVEKTSAPIKNSYAAAKVFLKNRKERLEQKTRQISASTRKKVRKLLRRPEV